MTLTMGPLHNHGEGDEESIGKALLLQSFISTTSESSGTGNQDHLEVEPTDENYVTLTRVATNLTSFVVKLKDKEVECPDPFEHVKIKRHPVRKHEKKARIALGLIFVFIGCMAVFAFMTLKRHSEKMRNESLIGSSLALEHSSNATDLSGYFTSNETTTIVSKNETTSKLVEKDKNSTATLLIGKL